MLREMRITAFNVWGCTRRQFRPVNGFNILPEAGDCMKAATLTTISASIVDDDNFRSTNSKAIYKVNYCYFANLCGLTFFFSLYFFFFN